MRLIALIPLMLLLALLGSCGEEEHDHSDHEGHDHSEHGDHSHDHGDHEGHDHAETGDDHGTGMELGTLTIGATSFAVEQFGSLKDAEEGVFSLKTDSDAGEVRVWVGSEDGRGSVKALLTYDSAHKQYHGHVEVPATLTDDAKLWASITEDGKTSSGSISFK